uniref:Glutathione peroxidase n=2 Tax=Cyprinus carpio TaxID=7962 RepID=A0A8C2J5Y6_CYPCA
LFQKFEVGRLFLFYFLMFLKEPKVVCNPGVGDTIHNYCAKTINGTQYIPFSYFAGKHVLIVNVATF